MPNQVAGSQTELASKVSNLESSVTSLNSKITTEQYTVDNPSGIGSVIVQKSGNICRIQTSGAINFPNGSTVICTLPAAYRPTLGVYQDVILPNGTSDFSAFRLIRFYLGPNGQLSVYNYGTAISYSNFQLQSIVYMV